MTQLFRIFCALVPVLSVITSTAGYDDGVDHDLLAEIFGTKAQDEEAEAQTNKLLLEIYGETENKSRWQSKLHLAEMFFDIIVVSASNIKIRAMNLKVPSRS